MEEEAVAASNPSGFISKNQKREAKETHSTEDRRRAALRPISAAASSCPSSGTARGDALLQRRRLDV